MDFRGKHALLRRLVIDHKCQSFVETGTYEARMSLAMSDSVKDVRTIELSETLHLENVARVEKAKKQDVVRLIHGHSVERLPEALEGAERPLVWLDALVRRQDHARRQRQRHACGR